MCELHDDIDGLDAVNAWQHDYKDKYRLAAAVVDRLTFNAHIINTGTSSYRLRSTRATKKGAAPA